MSIHGLEDQRHKADDPKRITDWLLAVRVRVRRRGPGKNTLGYFSGGAEEFEAVLRVAMRHGHRHDPPISITKVARAFQFTDKGLRTSYRQLYEWLKRYEVDFDATKLSIESEPL